MVTHNPLCVEGRDVLTTPGKKPGRTVTAGGT